jgi:putative transposase
MRAYAVELRVAIVEALGDGLSTSEAARRFGVSVSSVKRFRAQYQQTGDLAPRPHPGRPARIRRDDARLRQQVAAHPDATLAEHCAHWQEDTGCPVSLSTMSRMLVRAGCPRRPKPRTSRPPPASKPHTEAAVGPSPPSRSHPMSPERRPYPTDLTDAEWAILEPLVPPPKSGGRPARERREILDAIGYVVRTGCAWRYLPHDFPPWQTVYHYGVPLLPALAPRRDLGADPRRPPGTSPPNGGARGPAERGDRGQPVRQDHRKRGDRGYDGGKKVNGRKRHLLVDVTGLVLRVVVHAANLADSEGGKLVLDRITERYPELAPPLGRCRVHRRLRGVGSGGPRPLGRSGTGGIGLDRVPPGEEPAPRSPFPILPRRWVVERTFAWLGRYRRMSRDYEPLPQTQEALAQLRMIRLMLRRLAS